MRGCWFVCKIVKVLKNKFEVQYNDMDNVEGSGKLEVHHFIHIKLFWLINAGEQAVMNYAFDYSDDHFFLTLVTNKYVIYKFNPFPDT